jgi:hypothetical protein
MHGTKGEFSNSIWYGKDTMDRDAAGMERGDKKGRISLLFRADRRWQFLRLFGKSTVGGAAIASRICFIQAIRERWQRLFSRAWDQRGSGPAREMRLQRTYVLGKIEGLPAASLKGVQTNSNGLETD